MSELERIIELLEKILQNQQTALDRSGCEQSAPRFNLQDWGLPEQVMEKLAISLRSLYRYRQNGVVACTKIGGRSYYYFPDLLKLKNKFMK
jgi:hypothetical protein